MKLVVIESPYAGDTAKNILYAQLCCIDSLDRGEYPYASHLFYPQIISDEDPLLRELGMEAGFAWGFHADMIAVYTDLGVSPGMEHGIVRAAMRKTPIVCRVLPDHLLERLNE